VKKFYYLMFIAFAFFSCKKFESVNITSEKEFLLTEFRSQFKKDSILFYQKFDRTNYSYRQSLRRIIYWEQAKQVKDTIVIPVSLQLPNGVIDIKTGKNTLNHKVYLTISKDKNDRYTYEMITFIGNGSIAKNKFVGTILREGFFEGNIKYTSYYKGKVYKPENSNLQYFQSNKYNLLASRGGETDNCYLVLTVIAYVNGSPTDYRYERVCDRSDVYPEITDEVDDSSGGGGGGGDINSNPEISDCAGVLNGAAYIGECGKCVGGTTGINSCADIKNLIVNPCLKKMVNDILSKNLEFEAGKTLQSIFGINTSLNLTFTSSTSLPNSTGGVAIGQRTSINGNVEKLNVEIQLNENTLPNASQEYISMVIIHEAVHAHLYSKGIIGDPWPFGEHANAHHEIMWVNYISFISNYLVENFGTPLKDANSLAMEGLHRTMGSKLNDKIYLAINSKAKEPISDERARINTKYKLGQSGTKCNN